MPWNRGNEQFSGFEIVLSNFEYLEDRFFDVKYAEIKWRDTCPENCVDTTIPEGATTVSYGVRDIFGAGAFNVSQSGDIPTVGFNFSKPSSVPILTASVAGIISDDDIRTYRFAHGGALDTEIAAIMRRACDYHVEGVFFYGNPNVGFDGWMSNPDITTVQAKLNGGGTSRKFEDKSPDEILADFNENIGYVFSESKELHLIDTVFLPTKQFVDISTRRLGSGTLETTMTVLEYIRKNNIYTVKTGNELMIKSLTHLAEAGAGSTDRMVLIQNTDPEIQKFPFPIPYQFMPPERSKFNTHLLAEYRFGPWYIRYPGAALYVDEI